MFSSGLWLPTHLLTEVLGKGNPLSWRGTIWGLADASCGEDPKQKTSFVHLFGAKVSLTGLEKCKTSLEESLDPGKEVEEVEVDEA